MARVEMNGKQGFIDKSGDLVIPCSYKNTSNYNGKSVWFYDGNLWGVVDKNGTKTILGTGVQFIEEFSEGMAAIAYKQFNEYSFGFINQAGEFVVPSMYSKVYNYSDGLAAVRNWNGDYGYIDKKGKVVIPFQFENVGFFSEGLAWVSKPGGRYGLINKSGDMVVPYIYDSGSSFSDGMSLVRRDDGNTLKYGFIDSEGNEVIPCQYDHAASFSDGFASVCNGDKYGFIDKQGTIIVPIKFDRINKDLFSYGGSDFSDGAAWIRKKDSWKIVVKK